MKKNASNFEKFFCVDVNAMMAMAILRINSNL